MQSSYAYRGRVLLFLLVLLAILAGCAGAATPEGNASEGSTPETPAEKITIKLAENAWTGSRINVAVAKTLLEEQLGYTVELVTIDENAQWPALARGDIHASLEVWPSGHAENVAQYIEEQGVVERGGLIGPVGKIGWYIPTYMVEQHPELATWEGFENPELAALFSTAETGDKGQFLAGDPSWVQYDEQIIENLDLNLQVVHAGSEEALVAALDGAYSREEPILFYFYTPHSIFNRYELTEVELPAYSEECYAKEAEGGIDCAYPEDQLFKILWPGLKSEAPDAYHLLSQMSYTTEDQIEMIAAVEVEDKSPEEAAAAWLAAHEDTWKSWLP